MGVTDTVDGSNPRGYAFIALNNTYRRLMAWDWFAALTARGDAPTRYEFIEEGLRMWDRMTEGATPDEAAEHTNEIVKALSGSYRELIKGAVPHSGGRYLPGWILGYDARTGPDGEPSPLERSAMVAVNEPGFGEVELGSMVEYVLSVARRVASTDKQYDTFRAYLFECLVDDPRGALARVQRDEGGGRSAQALSAMVYRVRQRVADELPNLKEWLT